MQPREQEPLQLRELFRRIGMTALTILLMTVFYLAVIMGQPQGDIVTAVEPKADQPLLSALSAPLLIKDESQLSMLTSVFPAPMMAPYYGSALTFLQGLCSDVSFEDGLGRTVTLTYAIEGQGEMTITSIYPARALSLMGKGDYRISGTAGQSLAGLRSIRMENGTSIRLHAQGTDALYVVTTPLLEPAMLRQLTASLQLVEGQ